MPAGSARAGSRRRPLIASGAVALCLVGALVACTSEPGQPGPSSSDPVAMPALPVAMTRAPVGPVVLDGPDAVALAIQAANVGWERSPVAVTITEGDEGSLDQAALLAAELVVPLLVVPETGDAAPASASGDPSAAASPTADPLAAELARLGTTHVLHVGAAPPISPALPVTVVATKADLPAFDHAAPQPDLTVLTAPRTGPKRASAPASASLAAAGAERVRLTDADPRVHDDDVDALAARPLAGLIAVGDGFGPAHRFSARAEAAATGVQLPGGGQTVFDGKRYVALYGSPITHALGALGEQEPAASARRAAKVAASYEPYTDDQVIPAFEIIATVASGSAGTDKDYSNEWGIEKLRPLVDMADEEELLVVLDLQSGREDLLSQAKLYEELLREPHVGLALDPEWRLAPDEFPMEQIGSVHVDEINATLDWLAELTEANDLPQKLVLLHQFRTDMIRDRAELDLSHDALALVVQMDGDGTLGQKLDTWHALLADAPEGLRFGWKNFYDEDEPTPSPGHTFAVDPKPVWVSYQ